MRRWIEIGALVVAAACEVGGDALIRAGLRGAGSWLVIAGALTLAAYGVVVNLLPFDFSKLLGVYVGFFALFGAAFGKAVFRERISPTTWAGLAVIVLGSAIVQLGSR